jgi:hypothetical protein
VSTSFPEDLKAYLSSRWLTGPILLLIPLLLFAAWIPALPTRWADACTQTLLVANLVAMFRLWDDLSDLAVDRTTHPNRVLCRSSNERSFRWTCRVLGMTALSLLLLTNPMNAIGFTILTIIFASYYRLPWRSSWPRLSYHLLIIKYPCFVALISISADQPISTLRLMLIIVTYLSLCIYEVVHDPQLRADFWCRLIAAIEFVSAAIAVTCITVTLLTTTLT